MNPKPKHTAYDVIQDTDGIPELVENRSFRKVSSWGKPKPEKKPKTKRKQTKSERKLLEKMLDDITGDIVKLRDGGCITPGGCSGPLTVSHYYKRGKKKTRWSLVCCNAQCAGHNLRHNTHPQYYEEYMVSHYSQAELEILRRDAMVNGWQWKVTELRDMLDSRRAMWLEMTGTDWVPHKR